MIGGFPHDLVALRGGELLVDTDTEEEDCKNSDEDDEQHSPGQGSSRGLFTLHLCLFVPDFSNIALLLRYLAITTSSLALEDEHVIVGLSSSFPLSGSFYDSSLFDCIEDGRVHELLDCRERGLESVSHAFKE